MKNRPIEPKHWRAFTESWLGIALVYFVVSVCFAATGHYGWAAFGLTLVAGRVLFVVSALKSREPASFKLVGRLLRDATRRVLRPPSRHDG
jgi:hypothetical protein